MMMRITLSVECRTSSAEFFKFCATSELGPICNLQPLGAYGIVFVNNNKCSYFYFISPSSPGCCYCICLFFVCLLFCSFVCFLLLFFLINFLLLLLFSLWFFLFLCFIMKLHLFYGTITTLIVSKNRSTQDKNLQNVNI